MYRNCSVKFVSASRSIKFIVVIIGNKYTVCEIEEILQIRYFYDWTENCEGNCIASLLSFAVLLKQKPKFCFHRLVAVDTYLSDWFRDIFQFRPFI